MVQGQPELSMQCLAKAAITARVLHVEAEGPVPAVGMEWLQGKTGTCGSLGKGRRGHGK